MDRDSLMQIQIINVFNYNKPHLTMLVIIEPYIKLAVECNLIKQMKNPL